MKSLRKLYDIQLSILIWQLQIDKDLIIKINNIYFTTIQLYTNTEFEFEFEFEFKSKIHSLEIQN